MKSAAAARRVAQQVLLRVERDHAYGDRALDAALRRTELDGRDRALATELVYGTLRRQRYLDWVLNRLLKKPLEKLAPPIRIALRLGAYQLIETRVPARAAVYESVALVGSGATAMRSLVNAVLRRLATLVEEGALPDPLNEVRDPIEALAIASSHPTWLLRRIAATQGYEGAKAWVEAHRKAPSLPLRVTQRGRRDALAARLTSAGFQVRVPEEFPDALVLEQSGAIADLPGFAEGELVVQDLGAQLVARLASPAPGSVVLDACAAPGGKSAQLAELVAGGGHVVAVDAHVGRVRLVAETAARLHLVNLHASAADARDGNALRELLVPYGRTSFDVVLVDAPCSGLGTLRRHPELCERQEQEIAGLCQLQDDILEAVTGVVAEDGVLVYAVCTITREEGEERIAALLARHPELTLEDPTDPVLAPFLVPFSPTEPRRVLRTWPHRHGCDGFFAARLRRRRVSCEAPPAPLR